MRKMKSANQAALVIGIFGVFAGILSMVTGQEFYNYFMTFVISISLVGASFIDAYKMVEDEQG